jgi:hypothetical protein
MVNKVVYLLHESGANHAFGGRRLAKLLAELKAGRGGPEVTRLVENGYSATMGGLDLSALDYEALSAEASGIFAR